MSTLDGLRGETPRDRLRSNSNSRHSVTGAWEAIGAARPEGASFAGGHAGLEFNTVDSATAPSSNGGYSGRRLQWSRRWRPETPLSISSRHAGGLLTRKYSSRYWDSLFNSREYGQLV